MIPGPALRKECPYCKEVKELISLRSGNTFRGTHWSDTKKEYPMLPRTSEVQKCLRCGKYYFLADAKINEQAADQDHDNVSVTEFREIFVQNIHM